MGFANYIATKLGVLTIGSLRSPNFNAAARTGWQIAKDGSASFFDVTVEGPVTVTAPNGSQITIQGGASGAQILLSAAGLGSLPGATPAVIESAGVAVLTLSSGIEGGTDTPLNLNLLSQAQAGRGAPMAFMTGTIATQGAPGVAEDWHTVSVPAGMTGTIRVKLLAEAAFACLDINVTITSTSVTGTAFTGGALPSSAYYPTGQRQFPLTVNTGVGASATTPRVNIPSSGAIALDMPGFATAGSSCLVAGTVIYPLD